MTTTTAREATIRDAAYALGERVARAHHAYGRHDEYPLSGEWADDVTAADVYAHVATRLDVAADDLYSDECEVAADVFEEAYAGFFLTAH